MPSFRLALLALALAATAALAACGDARKVNDDGGSGGGGECGSCHGFPPPPGYDEVRFEHPQDASGRNCWSCHAATVDSENEILAGGAHLNGRQGDIEVVGDCDGCHGFPPPPGARLPWGGEAANHPQSFECYRCHLSSVNSRNEIEPGGTHYNERVDVDVNHPANFEQPDQHGPQANGGLTGCQDCHGADFGGGTSGVSCNTCHGTAGFADWQQNCTFCHGTQTQGWTQDRLALAAPPEGVNGQTAATDRGVGAHQAHLTGTRLGPSVACTECHTVPTTLGHVNGEVVVSLGGLSSRGGVTPAWNAQTATCGTYCHGATVSGGTNKTPTWTGGAAQAACGTCHGNPPPAPHPQDAQCGSCHDGYTATTVNATLHLNGTVELGDVHPAGYADPAQHGPDANTDLGRCQGCHGDDLGGGIVNVSCNACHGTAGFAGWQTNCTFCHGTQTPGFTPAQMALAAPPQGVNGQTASTDRAVGAHQAHVASGRALSPGFGCAECHPLGTGDLSHLGPAPADVAFGTLARTGGAQPAYTGAAAPTCASTYCHGRFTGGVNAGNGATVTWTDATAMTCASCHPASPTTGRHPASYGPHSALACTTCHVGFTATTVDTARHVNGAAEAIVQPTGGGAPLRIVGWDCGTCHNALGI